MSVSDPAPRSVNWRGVSIAEALVFGTLLIAIAVQYGRHRWPFAPVAAIVNRTPSDMTAPEHETATRSGHTADGGEHQAHQVPGRVAVQIPADQLALIGVRWAPVEQAAIAHPMRAVATIAPDESRVSHVHTRVAGWIERLYVNTTGERVRVGQPLAQIFSQELLASQNEYLFARQAAARVGPVLGDQSALITGARARLRVFGMTTGEIDALDRRNEAFRNVTLFAPRAGVVLHRSATVGTSVDPSTELMTIADLSRVWVFAEIPEADIPAARVGTPAILSFPASGEAPVQATIAFAYPTLTEETRTLRVRFEVPNPGVNLRPGMYGTASIQSEARSALVVPRDAIVDTGAEQHVFVRMPDGTASPRRVVPGVGTGDGVEIVEGLLVGEVVAASGVFLIDSESRLRASGAAGHGGHAGN